MGKKSKAEQDILDVWEEHSDCSAKEIQGEVFKRLGKKRSKGNTYPGIRTVQYKIQKFRANLGQLVAEDKPWNIGACIKYDIPANILPLLMAIQQLYTAHADLGNTLTIRQARWVAKLDLAFDMWIEPRIPQRIKDLLGTETKTDSKPYILSFIADFYATKERISGLLGEDYLDTTELDTIFFMEADFSSATYKLLQAFKEIEREFKKGEVNQNER